MTILEVVAILVGAVLGWASGALKAHLHSLRRPQGSASAGDESHPDVAAQPDPRRPGGGRATEHQPHAARQALFG